ncbi:uncharacterized protein KY384_008990 [Bacidia gigantensis]|uniref:uncharacterized protein n=1 Tax=Bacidia gigantensis TaxID=2732470 RepID=UPI001D04EA1C|nr:uncharacterized protein KY384_008990 [Bacidia gigantensis]KAG8525346.1 hypothetical protein KY384_008990 [Bacidia gigantensis]
MKHPAAPALKRLAAIQSEESEEYGVRRRFPQPHKDRLERSLQDRALDLCQAPKDLYNHAARRQEKQETFLYLAYGSNLFSGTFLGRRGIRPLSAINVVVPELIMTFDLPGIPYSEPCFANTKYRPEIPPTSGEGDEKASHSITERPKYHNPEWPRGLVGVVYEVTAADFFHILATEGGGAAYQDVLVDCYPLLPGIQPVPEHPSTDVFKAHTLYAPVYAPGKAPPGRERFSRPDPDYSQPSLRYITIIQNGADEHDFPPDYKAYLQELEPFTITSQRQRMGAFIFLQIWQPILTAIFKLSARYADDKGKSPKWLSILAAAIFTSVWISYDQFFHRIFGDGERTQPKHTDEERTQRKLVRDASH